MKRKKVDFTKKPWTAFVELPVGSPDAYGAPENVPNVRFANSRYDVMVYQNEDPDLGLYAHLSIKDHGRSARHDWRDLQRIKNEIVGPEYEAIEIYPAESRLLDSSNQYHLWVFKTWKIPVGFNYRLVADGISKLAPKAVQRPFDERPADCLSGEQFDELLTKTRAEKGLPPSWDSQ